MIFNFTFKHFQHVQVWIRLLQESRINTADWTIMSFKYFTSPELLTTWSPWAEGAALKDEPTLIPWWKVDRVCNLTVDLNI